MDPKYLLFGTMLGRCRAAALLLPALAASAFAQAQLSADGVPLTDDDSFRVGRVHNSHGAAVTEVHMVLSSHFDAGCKTPRCTAKENLLPGEPRLCAAVGAGNRPTL